MSVMETVSRLRARHCKGVRTNAPKGWLFVGASATRSAPSIEAFRAETDAAKVSVNEDGLSGDVTSRFIVDLMATSPVALATNELLRAGAIDNSETPRTFRYVTPTLISPRGVRKVLETFRFIFTPCRAAQLPSRPAILVRAVTRGVRQSRRSDRDAAPACCKSRSLRRRAFMAHVLARAVVVRIKRVRFASTSGFKVPQSAGPTSPDNLRSIQGASNSKSAPVSPPFTFRAVTFAAAEQFRSDDDMGRGLVS
mmetsp:Transcript_3098/g.8893  ORF Transcript_3098/g.8893 Transcript_3098/m.8893 type:complete len:253 (-) Transcript_3098:80-838(-)